MNKDIKNIEPKEVWNWFTALNEIPRPSKKEERAIQFMKNFGEQLNLSTFVDEVGNIIIKKPATTGMEDRLTVCLQGHIDMVHQKNATTIFDFDKQGIEMYADGDWVKAKGTTLGADNGMGVAAIMAILASNTISHPALEALFTIDEETGMTGAIGLKGGLLDASIMLNLDTEDDEELTIGCAGGVDVTGVGNYETQSVSENCKAFSITVKGLTGGHSGMDIHRGRGNANKIMNRILLHATKVHDIQIHSIDGGSLRNAIPRESTAIIVIQNEKIADVKQYLSEINLILKEEYAFTDPKLVVEIMETELPSSIFTAEFQLTLLRVLYAIHVGIYRMDSNIQGLVQTSNNLSRVLVKDGSYSIQNLTRSSSNSEKTDLADSLKSTLELLGASVTFSSSYPGWKPNPDAKIVKIMVALYEKLHNGHKPAVNACHAGLECGILGTNYPTMEMISFGPTITGAHSPDEKVSISSVQKFWKYLLATLKEIPSKN